MQDVAFRLLRSSFAILSSPEPLFLERIFYSLLIKLSFFDTLISYPNNEFDTLLKPLKSLINTILESSLLCNSDCERLENVTATDIASRKILFEDFCALSLSSKTYFIFLLSFWLERVCIVFVHAINSQNYSGFWSYLQCIFIELLIKFPDFEKQYLDSVCSGRDDTSATQNLLLFFLNFAQNCDLSYHLSKLLAQLYSFRNYNLLRLVVSFVSKQGIKHSSNSAVVFESFVQLLEMFKNDGKECSEVTVGNIAAILLFSEESKQCYLALRKQKLLRSLTPEKLPTFIQYDFPDPIESAVMCLHVLSCLEKRNKLDSTTIVEQRCCIENWLITMKVQDDLEVINDCIRNSL